MRLYAFIIISVGCLCLMVFTGFVCANILKVNLNDASLFVASLGAFVAVGLTGKWLQAKVETKNTIINAVATKMEENTTDDSSTAANITATGKI